MSNQAALECRERLFFEVRPLPESVEETQVLLGLRHDQKQVDPKYFYDTAGSELFERITQLSEYYPTRTERKILLDNAEAIAEACGPGSVLIEPGCGSCEKIRLLLDAINPVAYVPLDIARDFLHSSAQKLCQEYPWLNIHAICADFTRNFELPDDIPEGRRVVFYPGSTLGNMTPERAVDFLTSVRGWLNTDGGLLIGIDLHKNANRLNRAYNDAQGITAQFNLNVLAHLNRLFDANFDLESFSHRAFYDEEKRRIEMHLVSTQDQRVELGAHSIDFKRGETIHTENSYKYSPEDFSALATSAGFSLTESWFDAEKLFGFFYLEVGS